VLEGLSKASDLVLDKTGTLTMGQPELKEIVILRSGFLECDALAIAAALEAGQKHPLALSILQAAELQNVTPIKLSEPVNNLLGKGLSSGSYRLGSADWLGFQQGATNLSDGQYGQVYLADEQGIIASFVFLDTPRPGLENLLRAVKRKNIRVHLVSGDNARTVAWWAKLVGIENYRGACTPEDKFDYIDNLQREGRFVWAIGDGVNDAPLLARADVSVAVGAGAPLAAAGADAILTANSLEPLAKALTLADKTQAIIKQNLLWALVYNVLAIPAAMLGLVNPWIAGIGMSLSSLAVTLNAWRLRKA
jgi:Cu2+-exporting ATPase